MISLIVRLLILLAVVFGVAFGLSRLWRTARDRRTLQQIQDDLLALKAGLEDGLYSQEEYQSLRTKVMDACRSQGMDPPELPTHISKPKKVPHANEA